MAGLMTTDIKTPETDGKLERRGSLQLVGTKIKFIFNNRYLAFYERKMSCNLTRFVQLNAFDNQIIHKK